LNQWAAFVRKGKLAEKLFAQRHLSDIKWASSQQDKYEHWDMEGSINGKTSKFDVKEMKKINRWDAETQDVLAWIEGTNNGGKEGWIKGLADYIVFERTDSWLVVNREELFDFTWAKLRAAGFPKGKKAYHIYDRSFWGNKDKTTLVPFKDIEQLKDIKKLEK
tara:strand:- start:145 stop:633 length:489 start_codon:yes stop_codon:yes gene_type:complete